MVSAFVPVTIIVVHLQRMKCKTVLQKGGGHFSAFKMIHDRIFLNKSRQLY